MSWNYSSTEQKHKRHNAALGTLLVGHHAAKFRTVPFYIFFEIYWSVLFLIGLGLHRCTWLFSSSCEKGLLFVAARRLLTTVACLVVEHTGVRCTGSAPLRLWNLPGPGIKPGSLALQGRFLTSGPPGKQGCYLLTITCLNVICVIR